MFGSSRFGRPRAVAHRVASVLGLTFIVACGGSGGSGGCGGAAAKIKGGFPVDKRVENALALRITKPAFDFLEANAKPIIDKLLPPGGIPIPESCGGSTEICCKQTCSILFEFQTLKFDPLPPQTLKLTLRMKLKTSSDFNVKLPVVGTCKLGLDSVKSGSSDMGITLAVKAAADTTTKLTSMNFDKDSVDILDLDDGDIKISGGILCSGISLFKGTILKVLKDQLKAQLATPLETLFCQSCTTKDDCSSLANEGCSMNKQCMRSGVCMQQLGFEGLMDLSTLTGKPAGTGTQLEYYAVAGGYAAVEAAPTAGLSLGMLGGSTVTATSSCVPVRPAPSRATPTAKTPAYSGNAAPNGKPYHVGAGISTLELDTLGYSFYQSGALCISIGTEQADALSSGLLSALIPSLNDLTRGENTAIKIVLSPQQPPTFTLGKGTFKTDGMGKRIIDDPLLNLNIKDMAVDFYIYLDDRYVRFMRQTADIKVPLSLDVTAKNEILPMIGDLDTAFGNVRVSSSAMLKESPTQLARLFPSLLPVISGAIGALDPIALPGFSGLELSPVQITSTPDTMGVLSFLGLFLELKFPPMMVNREPVLFSAEPGTLPPETTKGAEVQTAVELVSLQVPTQAEMAVTAEQPQNPQLVLSVSAENQGSAGAEWQYRLDNGLWHLFDNQRLVTITEAALRLPGKHVVEVRGRTAGEPATLDQTPARLEFVVAPTAAVAPKASAVVTTENLATGCSQSGGRSGTPAGLVVLALTLCALVVRRRGTLRRPLAALGTLLVLGSVGCKQDVPVDEDPNAKADMAKGGTIRAEFSDTDELGRYQSAVVNGGKLYIAAYDSSFGDLAFTTITDPSQKPVWYPVDGLPSGDPQVTEGNATRGGYVDAGDDVGRYAALAFTSQGSALVAYQDVTNNAVKLAVRTGETWKITAIAEAKEGMGLGGFTQLVLGTGDIPTVAYMVAGVSDAMGVVSAQLVVATAKSASPSGPGDWTKKVVESTRVPCAGLCGTGQACVYVDPATKDKNNTVCKTVEKTCAPSCKTAQACLAAKCVDALGTPAAATPSGTGLYARLVSDKSGAQLLFYNRSAGALRLASGAGWAVTTLAGGDMKSDVGRYIGGTIGDDGTLHVAYSSADSRLYYLNVKAGKPSAAELVDDGNRTVGTSVETHQVGGGTYVYLDGGKPVIAYQDSTTATLELARRDTAWTHKTAAGAATLSRGFYPQAAQLNGKWWVIDVVYDRAADALTALGFTAP